jgi:hypothetical protein
LLGLPSLTPALSRREREEEEISRPASEAT